MFNVSRASRFLPKAPRPVFAALCLFLLAMTMPASAAVYRVTNSLDDGSAGCLRSVLASAQNAGPGNIVDLRELPLDNNGGIVITLLHGALPITTSATITGPLPSAESVIIDGNSTSRIFEITGTNGQNPALTVSITGLDLTDANSTGSTLAPGDGGAVYAINTTLTLTNCQIDDYNNSSFATLGGGLYVSNGLTTLSNTSISGNLGGQSGGGVYATNFAHLIVRDSFIDNNSVNTSVNQAAQGGGVYLDGGSNATFTGCDISGNTASSGAGAPAQGGGVYVSNTPANVLALIRCTIDNNTVSSGVGSAAQGGGLYLDDNSTATDTVTLCTFSSNTVNAGNGTNGAAGVGGSPMQAPVGNGTNGGTAQGGGIYDGVGLSLVGTTLSNNIITGGQGGNGGAGITGAVSFATASAGGDAGNGGDAAGGGVYASPASNISVTGCTLNGNDAFAGAGGVGGNGGAGGSGPFPGASNGANGGNGGTGGDGEGAGLSAGGGTGSGATLSVTNCTVYGNMTRSGSGASGGTGGAGGGGSMSMGAAGTNGAAGVTGGSEGGGLYSEGSTNNSGNGASVTVVSSTITVNQCLDSNGSINSANPGDGGGIGTGGFSHTTATLQNSIVAGNGSFNDPDVSGLFVSQDYNVVGIVTNGASGISAAHDQKGTAGSPLDAHLGDLGDNGGPTQTVSIGSISPAYRKITGSAPGAFPIIDQRGVTRPQGGMLASIGAFEPASGDTTAPSTIVTTNLGAVDAPGFTFNGSVDVTLTATDPDNAAAPLQYSASLDGGPAQANANNPDTVTAATDGAHTVSYQSTDGVNTENPQTLHFFIDTTAPVTTVRLSPALPNGANGHYNGTVQVTLTPTDAVSGVADTFYVLDGAPTDVSVSNGRGGVPAQPVVVMVNSTGPHTLVSYSVDRAGNIEQETTTTFTIDKVGTTTGLVSSKNPALDTDTPTFTATVTPLAGSSTPTGTVQFAVNGTNVGAPVALSSTGAAAYTATAHAPGSYTVTAKYSGDNNDVSSVSSLLTEQINPGNATRFAVTAPSAATAGNSFSVTVQAFDATGASAANYNGTVHITSSDSRAVLPANAALPSGAGQFTVTLNTAGSQTVTATDTNNSGLTGTAQVVVTSSGTAGHIAFVQQPGTTKAGASITPAPSVQVTDTHGSGVGGVSVTLSLLSGTGTLAGSVSQTTNAAGTATFTGMSINRPGQKTLSAAAPGNLTAASNPFTVTASDALTVKGIGITAMAGSAFTGTVATVADSSSSSPASDFTASVNWGDGTTTPGAVSGSSPFTITSSHTYLSAGTYTATITVTDTQPGNVSATGTATATVTSANAGPPVLHTFPAGLQMFSVTESYPSSAAAFGGQSQRLMIWNPAQLQYNLVTSLAPGQSYWVRFTQSTSLYDTGAPASMNAPYAISLAMGWNMIGNPFFTARALSGITVRDTLGVQGTFGQAVNAGVLSGTLYTYPGGATQYQTLGQNDALAPYNGCWVYAFKPCTLLVPTN